MKSAISFIAVCFACFAISACTAGILRIDTITVRHLPPSNATQIPEASRVSVLVKVEDHRSNSGGWLGGKLGKLRVGHAENGFGESIAPHIAVDRPLEMVFAKAFEDDLAAKGFSIQNNAPNQLVIAIDNFFTKFRSQFGLFVA
ncbi:MAG TPA: hypothetical protein VFF82_11985, partial [Rhodocyclaceae bacterium]|nr:hypothetical protein [Rhodocyclaceae bacterium]